jgi:hypothetical protein
MKYEIGDKVWIKNAEKITNDPTAHFNYSKGMEYYLNKTNKKDERFITILSSYIGSKGEVYYSAEDTEYRWVWREDMIDCSEKNYYKRFTPVEERWEILDL